MEKRNFVLILSVSFILGCVILALGMGNITKSERTISVRGLAEKEVSADLAVWKVSFSLGGNDLPTLKKDILDKTEIVSLITLKSIDDILSIAKDNKQSKKKKKKSKANTEDKNSLPYTRSQIGKMSNAEYLENEKLIMEQIKKGLIK